MTGIKPQTHLCFTDALHFARRNAEISPVLKETVIPRNRGGGEDGIALYQSWLIGIRFVRNPRFRYLSTGTLLSSASRWKGATLIYLFIFALLSYFIYDLRICCQFKGLRSGGSVRIQQILFCCGTTGIMQLSPGQQHFCYFCLLCVVRTFSELQISAQVRTQCDETVTAWLLIGWAPASNLEQLFGSKQFGSRTLGPEGAKPILMLQAAAQARAKAVKITKPSSL